MSSLVLCRLLYTRSGEWSDGTVPILATTAVGFTYIALLVVSLGINRNPTCWLQSPDLALLHAIGCDLALYK